MPNLKHTVKLNLCDIYKGTTTQFEVSYYKLINKNKHPTEEEMKCSECKGNGVVTTVRQIGPGMLTQSQQRCTKCKNGLVFSNKYFTLEKQKFSKKIPKGIVDGNKIVIENKGHDLPECFKDQFYGQERSNLEIVISENREYTVNGYTYVRGVNNSPFNVRLDINVEPIELLCGTYRNIPFINGELVTIKIPPGVIFEDGDNAVVIPKMGMPFYKQNNSYGDLFVTMSCKNNQDITTEQASKLWDVLKPNKTLENLKLETLKKTNNQFIEALSLKKFRNSDAYTNSEHNNHRFRRNNHDSDDDEHPQVGCAQQ
jgi:DnaJ family protein A protein 2